jgi:ankyrin repeat protein
MKTMKTIDEAMGPRWERHRPIHVAAGGLDLTFVWGLVLYGADVDDENEDGHVPLHFAISNGNLEMVNLLIKAGADLSPVSSNKEQLPPIMDAIRRGRHAIAAALLKASKNKRIEKNNHDLFADAVRDLLKMERSTIWKGAIVCCAYYKMSKLMDTLLESKTYDARWKYNGVTALMVTAHVGDNDAVPILLCHGCKVDDVDDAGRTALAHACMNGRFETAFLLMVYGSNPSLADSDGVKPAEHIANFLVRVKGRDPVEASKLGKHILSRMKTDMESNKPHIDSTRAGMEKVAEYYTNITPEDAAKFGAEKKQVEKKAAKNKRKNMKIKAKKRAEAERTKAETRSVDGDSDDEEIPRCQCVDCLALDAAEAAQYP